MRNTHILDVLSCRFTLLDIQEKLEIYTNNNNTNNIIKPFQHYITIDVINRIHQLDKIIVEITPSPPTIMSTIIHESSSSSSFSKHHHPTSDNNYHSRTGGGVRNFSNGPRAKYTNNHHTNNNNHHTTGDTHPSNQDRLRNKKGGGRYDNYHNHQANEEWNAMKSVQPPMVKEGIEKNINNVRGALNKITNKNYEIQRDIVLENIQQCFCAIEDSTLVNQPIAEIGQFIFDIASTNKFYGSVYADLFTELVKKYDIFTQILHTFVETFQQHILQDIQYIDSAVNYDAYCDYTKMNDKRRATAAFLVMLMIREVIPQTTIFEMIAYFQRTSLVYVDMENRTNEMDEMTELFSLFITLGKEKLHDCLEWKEQIVPHIHTISLYKVKEHMSLSSRSLFKYKDLLKFVEK